MVGGAPGPVRGGDNGLAAERDDGVDDCTEDNRPFE